MTKDIKLNNFHKSNRNTKYSLAELNKMTQEEFTEVLADIWEHTPEIAAKCWSNLPFTNIDTLYNSMVKVVEGMGEVKQLALIKAHPDLGSKAKMAEASVKEQAGVGLDRLNSEEYNRFLSLNNAYKNKFGFPFIIAVKNHTKESILESFEHRLENSQEQEKKTALLEISKIARLRLDQLITGQ
ncbi:MAG: 2-oxo-4-hydroxy-4-carboxy-5-ureidoimidazoline decarboxylase [Xenococcaceae cyanobacterium MO_167.B52]|nr:2-oxo-4-hydroxy-4-carboxy-5-ureidoimidazoline decarboxylase [Xenococcaceae cyanobacterium MO_167.B52]